MSLLAVLKVSNNAAVVLSWFVSLVRQHLKLFSAMLTQKGYCLTTQRLLRYVLHLSKVQGRPRSTRHPPRQSPP